MSISWVKKKIQMMENGENSNHVYWFSFGLASCILRLTLFFTISTNMVALCTDEVGAAVLPYNVGPSSAVWVIFKLYATFFPVVCVQNVKLSCMQLMLVLLWKEQGTKKLNRIFIFKTYLCPQVACSYCSVCKNRDLRCQSLSVINLRCFC